MSLPQHSIITGSGRGRGLGQRCRHAACVFFLPCNSCTKKMCYNEYGCKTHRCRLRRSAARATESAATDAAKADAAARAAVRGEDADMEAEVQRLQVRISL